MKDWKVKQFLSRGRYQWEGEDKWRGQIWLMYFACVYVNKIVKPVEIVPRSGEGE
jgi:hypothetical protein